ncbi:MAG: 30S ribosomal protein S3, partial [Clostridiales bacterium]|nr:30S ribosomal protein S3 [Candidatus Coliplasma equi]
MGQKVNPHGLRVGVIKDWSSRWYSKDETFGDTLVSDYNLRKFLKERLMQAGVPEIEIERDNSRIKVIIHCAKPGIIIGKGGTEIEKLKKVIADYLKVPANVTVDVKVIEIKQPDLNAQLVAENIAAQLEKRISFRRAMKKAIGST